MYLADTMFIFDTGIGINGNGEQVHQVGSTNLDPEASLRQLARLLRDFAGNDNSA